MYIVDVKKKTTVETSSLDITSLIEMRVEATKSPAKLSPAITACVYFLGNMLAKP